MASPTRDQELGEQTRVVRLRDKGHGSVVTTCGRRALPHLSDWGSIGFGPQRTKGGGGGVRRGLGREEVNGGRGRITQRSTEETDGFVLSVLFDRTKTHPSKSRNSSLSSR